MKRIGLCLFFALITIVVIYSKNAYQDDKYVCINNKKMFISGNSYIPMKDELNIEVPCKN